MKNFIIILCVLFTTDLFGVSEKPVKSSIKKVTVFTQGAQVFRSAPVSISPGITQLIFSGLSPQINPSSVQATGKGAFVILDVKHSIKYPEPLKSTSSEIPKSILIEISVLEDSLTELGFRRNDISERRNALLLEKEMITKNKLAKAEGKSDSSPSHKPKPPNG
jgi:N-terminal domain of unknown function (DUF4140)